MENLFIERTRNTPLINFDCTTGIMKIVGRSIPESAHDFWHPVADWIIQYSQQPRRHTVLKVQLEYVNTSSSKYFLDVFKLFEKIHREPDENTVAVEWYYEEYDEDMMEMGEDFKSILRLPFDIKILPE